MAVNGWRFLTVVTLGTLNLNLVKRHNHAQIIDTEDFMPFVSDPKVPASVARSRWNVMS